MKFEAYLNQKEYMIEQLDDMFNKFLDYQSPTSTQVELIVEAMKNHLEMLEDYSKDDPRVL